jgi:hypothetical protein
MTAKQKNDFKAVLKVLVYSGVSNIPKTEKEEVKTIDKKNQSIVEEDGEPGILMVFLKKVGWWMAFIVI